MNEQLYKLLQKAREDAELRKRIWAVKEAKEFFCNLFRSCNGSAVQPLDGWDDPFDMFFAAMEALEK